MSFTENGDDTGSWTESACSTEFWFAIRLTGDYFSTMTNTILLGCKVILTNEHYIGTSLSFWEYLNSLSHEMNFENQYEFFLSQGWCRGIRSSSPSWTRLVLAKPHQTQHVETSKLCDHPTWFSLIFCVVPIRLSHDRASTSSIPPQGSPPPKPENRREVPALLKAGHWIHS